MVVKLDHKDLIRKMLLQKFNLQGKVALITGASGLLGQQHAEALLETGAKVVMTDISKDGLASAKKRLSERFNESLICERQMDVTDIASVKQTSEYLIQNNINVDILVNNAAIDPKVGISKSMLESSRLENFDLATWNSQLSVGLTGAFICSQTFGNQMVLNKVAGVILNIASDLSVISPDQRLYIDEKKPKDMQPVKPVAYSVIKSGLIGLTRYLATYWSAEGIRCNALSPGGIFTNQDDVFVKRIKKLIPMNRMAEKDEYRSVVQFLCSDASSYMNGQNIVVDGGRSVW